MRGVQGGHQGERLCCPPASGDVLLTSSLLPQVRWFRDGSEIRKGKKYEIVAQGRQHILIVHKSVFDDEAEYECDARTSKSSGMLTVIGKGCRCLRPLFF